MQNEKLEQQNKEAYLDGLEKWNYDINPDPYRTFFNNGFDHLRLHQLFPPSPFSKNILDDIVRRTFNFPYFLRKSIMSHFKWSIVNFFSKINLYDDIDNLSRLSEIEEKTVLKITLHSLRLYIAYLMNQYAHLNVD